PPPERGMNTASNRAGAAAGSGSDRRASGQGKFRLQVRVASDLAPDVANTEGHASALSCEFQWLQTKAWMLDELTEIDKTEHFFSGCLARDGWLLARLSHPLTQQLRMLRWQLCSSKRTH